MSNVAFLLQKESHESILVTNAIIHFHPISDESEKKISLLFFFKIRSFFFIEKSFFVKLFFYK